MLTAPPAVGDHSSAPAGVSPLPRGDRSSEGIFSGGAAKATLDVDAGRAIADRGELGYPASAARWAASRPITRIPPGWDIDGSPGPEPGPEPSSQLTKNVSSVERQQLSRERKYRNRDVLRDVSQMPRIKACGCRRISKDEGVGVRMEGGTAHYTNVQLCGSVNACPVCGAKIRQERAEEIKTGLTFFLSTPMVWGDGKACRIEERESAAIGGVEMLTLTLPHHQGDELRALLDAASIAFRRVLGGSGMQRDRLEYQLVGTIRALEVTVGRNGWHPHLHVLLLTGKPLTPQARASLHRSLFDRWAGAIEDRGFDRPLWGITRLEPVRQIEDAASYLNKLLVDDEGGKARAVSLEMTRHDLKAGRVSPSRGTRSEMNRTPFQVLSDFADTGDVEDLDTWLTYEREIKGQHALDWSRGLKALLGLRDRTDAEIVEEEVGGEEVCQLASDAWYVLTREKGARARVLELAEKAGAPAVELYVAELLERWYRADRIPFNRWTRRAIGPPTPTW